MIVGRFYQVFTSFLVFKSVAKELVFDGNRIREDIDGLQSLSVPR